VVRHQLRHRPVRDADLSRRTEDVEIVPRHRSRDRRAPVDIKEIKDKTFAEVYAEDFITATWEAISRCRKPTLAAVSGHVLGGGCELAMMCDIIIASETARFSLPETRIGVIPGAGGTQRLSRIVGKHVAMDMILTGRALDAHEALAHGLASRVAPVGEHLALAVTLAKKITASSRPDRAPCARSGEQGLRDDPGRRHPS
jgi:enoyl-CoA hydratase